MQQISPQSLDKVVLQFDHVGYAYIVLKGGKTCSELNLVWTTGLITFHRKVFVTGDTSTAPSDQFDELCKEHGRKLWHSFTSQGEFSDIKVDGVPYCLGVFNRYRRREI